MPEEVVSVVTWKMYRGDKKNSGCLLSHISRVIGELRSTLGVCQPGLVYYGCHWVPDMIFCLVFRVVCPSPMPFCYAISFVFYLHIETCTKTASNPMFLDKKQIKKEEERLTTELQLMTRERNDLKERLMILTEGTVDNRCLLFQTSWSCQQCHPHLLSF